MNTSLVHSPSTLEIYQLFEKIPEDKKSIVLKIVNLYVPKEVDIPDDFFTSIYDTIEYRDRQECIANSFGLSLDTWVSLTDEQQMEMMGLVEND